MHQLSVRIEPIETLSSHFHEYCNADIEIGNIEYLLTKKVKAETSFSWSADWPVVVTSAGAGILTRDHSTGADPDLTLTCSTLSPDHHHTWHWSETKEFRFRIFYCRILRFWISSATQDHKELQIKYWTKSKMEWDTAWWVWWFFSSCLTLLLLEMLAAVEAVVTHICRGRRTDGTGRLPGSQDQVN